MGNRRSREQSDCGCLAGVDLASRGKADEPNLLHQVGLVDSKTGEPVDGPAPEGIPGYCWCCVEAVCCRHVTWKKSEELPAALFEDYVHAFLGRRDERGRSPSPPLSGRREELGSASAPSVRTCLSSCALPGWWSSR